MQYNCLRSRWERSYMVENHCSLSCEIWKGMVFVCLEAYLELIALYVGLNTISAFAGVLIWFLFIACSPHGCSFLCACLHVHMVWSSLWFWWEHFLSAYGSIIMFLLVVSRWLGENSGKYWCNEGHLIYFQPAYAFTSNLLKLWDFCNWQIQDWLIVQVLNLPLMDAKTFLSWLLAIHPPTSAWYYCTTQWICKVLEMCVMWCGFWLPVSILVQRDCLISYMDTMTKFPVWRSVVYGLAAQLKWGLPASLNFVRWYKTAWISSYGCISLYAISRNHLTLSSVGKIQLAIVHVEVSSSIACTASWQNRRQQGKSQDIHPMDIPCANSRSGFQSIHISIAGATVEWKGRKHIVKTLLQLWHYPKGICETAVLHWGV